MTTLLYVSLAVFGVGIWACNRWLTVDGKRRLTAARLAASEEARRTAIADTVCYQEETVPSCIECGKPSVSRLCNQCWAYDKL